MDTENEQSYQHSHQNEIDNDNSSSSTVSVENIPIEHLHEETHEETDINILQNIISSILPGVIKKWNNDKLPVFEELFMCSYKEYFNKKQTQEKTKLISPILDKLIAELTKKKDDNFTITDEKGYDFTYGKSNTRIEWKNSLSPDNSWTGNGYTKTSWHVLCKFIINEDGFIEKYLCCILPLNSIKSKWSETKDTSNFSSLKLINDDYCNIKMVAGDFNKKQKYLSPVFKSVT